MTTPTTPDWNVAIVDGQPEVVINLPAVAALVKTAPIGQAEAMRRLRSFLPPESYAEIKRLVGGEE
ncbi:hypothetical protein GCM10009785_13940 [Brooklawnia cerclae]|uniref:Uncharacterized protein n=1 Tax=Brooklawnia cerclae TaxID=349934 RepID=A0ABX0SJ97_9ACTN|nr:hypothetical protein [Brooklawnia cerclae]NIH58036.1 hypothetical protein [Brooklawnia cerclae]